MIQQFSTEVHVSIFFMASIMVCDLCGLKFKFLVQVWFCKCTFANLYYFDLRNDTKGIFFQLHVYQDKYK